MREESGEGMKPKRNASILAAAVATLAVLLLAGCHQGDRPSTKIKDQKDDPSPWETEIHEFTPIDTSQFDEEFYKRMRLFKALHPNIPSDK